MGKSITPTYRLEIDDKVQAWKGRATESRLEQYISLYIDSLKIGGVNEHLSKSLGYIPIPKRATIVHQKTCTVVAEWEAPAFMVF